LERLDSADTPLGVDHLLALLALTGLYMFVLPYAAKWRSK
jgi:hypothetical protein